MIQEKFTITNMTAGTLMAKLWGYNLYQQSENFGSNVGIKIEPLDTTRSYLSYMMEYTNTNGPFQFSEIELRTNGWAVIWLCSRGVCGDEVHQKINFEDKMVITPDDIIHESLRSINGDNWWKFQVNASQNIEVIIRGGLGKQKTSPLICPSCNATLNICKV